MKNYRHNGRHGSFSFYRDKDKKEVDLLIEQDGRLYPLEIKKTAKSGKHLVQKLRILDRLKQPCGPGGILCLTQTWLPITEHVKAIPAGYV